MSPLRDYLNAISKNETTKQDVKDDSYKIIKFYVWGQNATCYLVIVKNGKEKNSRVKKKKGLCTEEE